MATTSVKPSNNLKQINSLSHPNKDDQDKKRKTHKITLNKVDPRLRHYIETNIYPYYLRTDGGHGLDHIHYVTNRSFMFMNQYYEKTGKQLDPNIVFTVASCHDCGLAIGPRNEHEKNSASIVRSDKFLTEFFDNSTLNIITEAVEDHRASLNKEPRSIYGKIVSQADRDTSLPNLISRTYAFRKDKPPYNMNIRTLENDMMAHIIEKFGKDGYARDMVWFEDEKLENLFSVAEKAAKEPERFRRTIENYIQKNDPEKYRSYMRINELPCMEQEHKDSEVSL